MIREHAPRNGKPDEISVVLGSDGYYQNHYDRRLRDLVLGVHSTDLVRVSRYYPMLEPKVVVDFEPPKPDKMYCEEKRKYFMEKGVVYIPIFLNQTFTKDQFAELVEQEKKFLAQGYREVLEDQALVSKGDHSPILDDPKILAEIDAQALKIVSDMGLRGAAKLKRLKREKERLLRERTLASMGSNTGHRPASLGSF
jgi:hypothetical protein